MKSVLGLLVLVVCAKAAIQPKQMYAAKVDCNIRPCEIIRTLTPQTCLPAVQTTTCCKASSSSCCNRALSCSASTAVITQCCSATITTNCNPCARFSEVQSGTSAEKTEANSALTLHAEAEQCPDSIRLVTCCPQNAPTAACCNPQRRCTYIGEMQMGKLQTCPTVTNTCCSSPTQTCCNQCGSSSTLVTASVSSSSCPQLVASRPCCSTALTSCCRSC